MPMSEHIPIVEGEEESKKFHENVKEVKRQVKAHGIPEKAQRGVIYLGHIPHGFYEKEMRGYFSQFGTVTRLKLARSKKTGRSRGYAFIEFASSKVASIVADTMNNYLMFEKLLKCHVVPASSVKNSMFLGVRPGQTPPAERRRIAALRALNEASSTLQKANARRRRRRNSSLSRTTAALKALGVDFVFELPPPPQKCGGDSDVSEMKASGQDRNTAKAVRLASKRKASNVAAAASRKSKRPLMDANPATEIDDSPQTDSRSLLAGESSEKKHIKSSKMSKKSAMSFSKSKNVAKKQKPNAKVS